MFTTRSDLETLSYELTVLHKGVHLATFRLNYKLGVTSAPTSSRSNTEHRGNLFAPVLSKASAFDGQTLNIADLESEFIEFGDAKDEDGHSVSVTCTIEPETSLIGFDAQTNRLELQLEELVELGLQGKAREFQIDLEITDSHEFPRSTTYQFKLELTSLLQS